MRAISHSHTIGQFAEEQAWQYLRQQGLRLIARNYRCKMGEIDLILRDQTDLVFVEVRFRKISRFGHATDTIDHRKQHKLIKTATHYLQYKAITSSCRFDVISITAGYDKNLDIEWIKNAFQVEY